MHREGRINPRTLKEALEKEQGCQSNTDVKFGIQLAINILEKFAVGLNDTWKNDPPIVYEEESNADNQVSTQT